MGVMRKCEKEYIDQNNVNISAIRNTDEVKYAVAPLVNIQVRQ